MTIIRHSVFAVLVMTAGWAQADCAINQPVEAIMDCIVEEGAGGAGLSQELSQPFEAEKDVVAEVKSGKDA